MDPAEPWRAEEVASAPEMRRQTQSGSCGASLGPKEILRGLNSPRDVVPNVSNVSLLPVAHVWLKLSVHVMECR